MKRQVWPCAFCHEYRDSKQGIQLHEHYNHGQESPLRKQIPFEKE